MKIGIDASPVFVQRGGVGIYTLQLIENLTKIESPGRFFLFTTNRPKERFPFLERPNVTLIQGPRPYLRYRIWREQIDVVHGPNFRLPGKGRKGNIVTIHDLALERYPGLGKKGRGARFSSWKTKRRALSADRIIAVSESTRKDIESIFGVPPGRIVTIYNGVDAGFYPDHDRECLSGIRKSYGIDKEKFILFTGTIEPRKNIPTLLRAYAMNPLIRREFNLVLAGAQGWKNEPVHQFISSEKLGKEVILTGYLSRKELRVLYSFASSFVFPSIYEGFGIPPLEAMACGAPVICSNASSLPEVVGEAAITLNPDDEAQWSAHLLRLLNDEGLKEKLRTAGFERVKHFRWEKTAVETLKVYTDVMSGR